MRCFIPPASWASGLVELPAGEAHYLRDVLRVRAGEALTVFDGAGRTASAVCKTADKRGVGLEVGEAMVARPATPRFHLVQALAKGQKLDWILQKSTELGVDVIHPVRTRHAVVKLTDGDAARKTARWHEILLGATRQSGRAWLPRLAPVCDLADCLAGEDRPEVLLGGDLDAGAKPLGAVLAGIDGATVESIGICIGPEGDWSGAEKEALARAGVVGVTLGETVLRTETAAIYALSVLRYEFRAEPHRAS